MLQSTTELRQAGSTKNAICAVVAEFIGATSGLGYLIIAKMQGHETDDLFAAIIVLSTLGLILYFVVHLLRVIFIPWHESTAPLQS